MIQSYGLTHIQLAVRDLEKSIHFYQQILGMEELCRFPEAVMLRTPGSHEVFTLNAQPDSVSLAGQMGGIAHFGFRLQQELDVTAIMEKVEQAGGKALTHGMRGKDKKESYLFLSDPDGYEVELFWMPAE